MGKDKRRVWRKLHLGVDTTTGEIVAHALTPSETHDGAELEGLLADVAGPIAAVYADGPMTPSTSTPRCWRAGRSR